MYCIMNNIKSRIKYITDLEFKIEDKYLVLGGYYNSLKRTTPRIIAKRITTFSYRMEVKVLYSMIKLIQDCLKMNLLNLYSRKYYLKLNNYFQLSQ